MCGVSKKSLAQRIFRSVMEANGQWSSCVRGVCDSVNIVGFTQSVNEVWWDFKFVGETCYVDVGTHYQYQLCTVCNYCM